jgi:hypothetical protein
LHATINEGLKRRCKHSQGAGILFTIRLLDPELRKA